MLTANYPFSDYSSLFIENDSINKRSSVIFDMLESQRFTDYQQALGFIKSVLDLKNITDSNHIVHENLLAFQMSLSCVLLESEDSITEFSMMSVQDRFLWNSEHFIEIYKLEKEGRGQEASVYSTLLMYYATKDNNVDFINHFFKVLDYKKVTRWSLIALLRTTCIYKSDIESWKNLYLYTRNLIDNEGLNAKRLLVGLDRGLNLNG